MRVLTRRVAGVLRESPDQAALIAAAIASVGLSIVGIAKVEHLVAVAIGLMSLLAFSQIRLREDLSRALSQITARSLDGLLSGFPSGYFVQRGSLRSSYMFIGVGMTRTLSTGHQDFEDLLHRGGSIRVLLPDFRNPSLMEMVSQTHRNRSSPIIYVQQIEQAIASLRELRSLSPSGDVEVRLTSALPRASFNLMDTDQRSGGTIMVQHYEFRPPAESGPIMLLNKDTDVWYKRSKAEADRLWNSGSVVEL